ncbi:hypothetical protein CDD80_1270 [Ophiocordyceps camponoti-rufipedis]|uniref:Uncharacterized protein n=1 Tax=Ophiocordyceps camponoti-rufipedis TaxID=2004952 RepID=A0A2C5ZKY8_9HYPO|nr:hypothetical protein CDD80_1270 [Ophiocordyceps camponoti-rufipedis]
MKELTLSHFGEQCLAGCVDCAYIDWIVNKEYRLRKYVWNSYGGAVYDKQERKIKKDGDKRWKEFHLKEAIGDTIGKTDVSKKVKKKLGKAAKQREKEFKMEQDRILKAQRKANRDRQKDTEKRDMEKVVTQLIQDVRLRWDKTVGNDTNDERTRRLEEMEKRINEVLPVDLRFALLKYYIRYPPPPVKDNRVHEELRQEMKKELDKWRPLRGKWGPQKPRYWVGPGISPGTWMIHTIYAPRPNLPDDPE